MKIKIARDLCIGDGTCVAIAPKVFKLDKEGKVVVIDPHGADDQTIKSAAESCPTQAIILSEEDNS